MSDYITKTNRFQIGDSKPGGNPYVMLKTIIYKNKL